MASLDTAAQLTRSVGRRTKALLFFGFAFAVMADPVSSVAYAIEAPLRALGGHLNLLLPTMGVVIGIIALVTLNYWQLVRRFPEGGGSPEAAGRAFGEEWSFLPIGALVVDFALTIAISIAAAGSALVALAPALAPLRIPIDLVLIASVAALTWFGHGGRLIFAAMTSLFIVASVPVLGLGWLDPHQAQGSAPITDSASPALVAVILAFPVAMALATGTEAPATYTGSSRSPAACSCWPLPRRRSRPARGCCGRWRAPAHEAKRACSRGSSAAPTATTRRWRRWASTPRSRPRSSLWPAAKSRSSCSSTR